MKILLTGAAGFIGFHTARKLLARGDEVVGPRQSQRLLRSEPQARAPRHPGARAEVPLREDGSGRQGRHEGAVRAREVSARDSPRRAGRRALLARESAGVCRQQRHRHAQRARGLPAQRRGAPGVRLHQLGVRPQHQHALHGAPRRRSSAVAVCHDQARQRAHGAQLCGAVQTTRDRPAFLHGVWTVGPARHGAVPVHEEHPRGQAHRRVQSRSPQARLHLRRRHRRGRGARLRSHRGAERRMERATIRIRPPAARHSGSTTSATTRRWS